MGLSDAAGAQERPAGEPRRRRPPGASSRRALGPAHGSGDPPGFLPAVGGRGAPPWGLGQVVVGLVAGFVLANLGVGAYVGVTGQQLPGGADYPPGLLVADLFGLWIGLAGAALYAARRASSTPAREFGLRVRPWPDIPLGLGVGVGFQLIVIPLVYAPLAHFVPNLDRSLGAPARQLTGGSHGWTLIITALLVAVGAPLVEELFFRGLLLRSLENRFRSLGSAGRPISVGVSAVIFGLVHTETLQLLGLVLFGLALGALAERSGRLGPGIVAHAAFNAVAVVAISVVR